MKQLSAFFQKQVMLNQKNLVGELFMVFLVIGLFWVAKFQQIADLKIETFRIQQSVQSSYLRYDAQSYSKTSKQGKMVQALNEQLSGTGENLSAGQKVLRCPQIGEQSGQGRPQGAADHPDGRRHHRHLCKQFPKDAP